eukprot:4267266-Pyramimonas_sp.AAC.1
MAEPMLSVRSHVVAIVSSSVRRALSPAVRRRRRICRFPKGGHLVRTSTGRLSLLRTCSTGRRKGALWGARQSHMALDIQFPSSS